MHSLEPISNGLSMLQFPFTIAVLVLTFSGKLHPRKPYFIATGYYFFMIAFGTVTAALAIAKGGPEIVLKAESPGLAILTQQLSWAVTPIWVLTVIFVVVAVNALQLARHGFPIKPSLK